MYTYADCTNASESKRKREREVRVGLGDENMGGHPLNQSNDSRRRHRPYVFSLNQPINRRNRWLIEWSEVDCRTHFLRLSLSPPIFILSISPPFARALLALSIFRLRSTNAWTTGRAEVLSS